MPDETQGAATAADNASAAEQAIDSVIAGAIVALIKAKVPVADDKVIIQICEALGYLFIDIANDLAAKDTA